MKRALWFFHLLAVLVTLSFVLGELFRTLATSFSVGPHVVEAGGLILGSLLLMTIWCFSTVRQPSTPTRWYFIGTHVSWVALFTWFVWFSSISPFRMHEIRIPGLFEGADIGRAELIHNLVWGGIYVALVALFTMPLLLRGRRGSLIDKSPRGGAELPTILSSVGLLIVSFADPLWRMLVSTAGQDSADVGRNGVLMGALVLICWIAGRGGVRAVVVGLAEAILIPMVWIFR